MDTAGGQRGTNENYKPDARKAIARPSSAAPRQLAIEVGQLRLDVAHPLGFLAGAERRISLRRQLLAE